MIAKALSRRVPGRVFAVTCIEGERGRERARWQCWQCEGRQWQATSPLSGGQWQVVVAVPDLPFSRSHLCRHFTFCSAVSPVALAPFLGLARPDSLAIPLPAFSLALMARATLRHRQYRFDLRLPWHEHWQGSLIAVSTLSPLWQPAAARRPFHFLVGPSLSLWPIVFALGWTVAISLATSIDRWRAG